MDDLQRQVRIALFAFLFIIPAGIIGFMFIEGMNFLDASYLTIITLSTIGYGDISPNTPAGRVFTMVLVTFGLSAFAFAAQATIGIITSPVIRIARQKRQIQNKIGSLSNHYIICGMGEMVDKTIEYLQQNASARRKYLRELQYRPIDGYLDRFFGDDEHGHHLWLRRPLRRIAMLFISTFQAQATLLDIVVVITQDSTYAEHLRGHGLLVVEGNPTDSTCLIDAGIVRAQAMMVMLDNDTETLLTVLTAHNIVPTMHITAAVLDDELSQKMTRVGATIVITPFDTAGQFLNNATLRPAVNSYFNHILFEQGTTYRVQLIEASEQSPWIGQRLGDLRLRERFDAGVIGIRYEDARFGYAPDDDTIINEDEILIAIVPIDNMDEIAYESQGDIGLRRSLWQPIPFQQDPPSSDKTYSLMEAAQAIEKLSKHFIICGNDRVARSAISRLAPDRPFVIISNDNTLTSDLMKRGFRVIHGDPKSEETLIKAGVKRAQAIMVALEQKADSILTILNSRALNRGLLITATANTDDMIDKLERAGADRVVSPFHVAARFTLISTTQPELSAFMEYVLYNYRTGLETTEIYLEQDSVWIGKTIQALALAETYDAGVIGVRLADAHTFVYAPPADYVIGVDEVLIIVTPMIHSDTLREMAHGGQERRPTTLRSRVLQTSKWTADQIQDLVRQGKK